MRTLPVLPLRDAVVFPGTQLSLIVGRARSVAAIGLATSGDKQIVLVSQRRSEISEVGPGDVYDVGTIADISNCLELPDGKMKIMVHVRDRVRLHEVADSPSFMSALVQTIHDEPGDPERMANLVRSVDEAVEQYVSLHHAAPPDMVSAVRRIEKPGRLADLLVGAVKLTMKERQRLLETLDVHQRLEWIHQALAKEIEFLQVEKKLRTRVQRERDRREREVWLTDPPRSEGEGGTRPAGRAEAPQDEHAELLDMLRAKALPAHARARAEREVSRLEKMNPMSAEATVVRNYLDWVLALPWGVDEAAPEPPEHPEQVLAERHFGLQEVKDRVVEYLAVDKLTEDGQGPVMCLAGPPGVGKTSFARAIAAATGRPFVRIALGGVRDEAEIRGHRRTYIGAMPGRIVQAMKRATSAYPVVLLDEVDKLSTDFRGDPSSALLEVLDPEQNGAFNDHYLDMDFDLSKVMFLCTANNLGAIPGPLRDRLEIIELTGYTEDEKVRICQDHLLPRVAKKSGVGLGKIQLDDATCRAIVRHYTRESGVRSLERQLARMARKVAVRVVEEGPGVEVHIDVQSLHDWLGPRRFDIKGAEGEGEVGLVKGLSVSSVGGAVLDIEVVAIAGKGDLKITGQPGTMMKESAQAAMTWVRSRASVLGVAPDVHEKTDVHIHYPAVPGGVEGPSAGIGMVTALVSALTGRPVAGDVAMTGEVSLRGRVLRIGGLKEKLLAAHRGGLHRVLIPEENLPELSELPDRIRAELEVVAVRHMDEVLAIALAPQEGGQARVSSGEVAKC